MKKYILYLFLLVLFSSACKKDEQMQFQADDNIYLDYYTSRGELDTTSITYSFAYTPGLARDTLWIPVKISGKRSSADRRFALQAIDSLSTATSDLHYEPLQEFYILPADSGSTYVPLILKNTDPELSSKSVSIALTLKPTSDFGTDLPKDLLIKRFTFSNRLERPFWWMFWEANLGEYSRIKHQLFLIASGTRDLVDMSKPDAYLEIPRTLFYIDNIRLFVKDPFTWVTRHPEKGYVITPRSESRDYDFYSAGSPEIKFHIKYIPEVASHFFIDENGKQIIM